MNDHYYKLICEFIPIHERNIINKNTSYIIGIKKKRKLIQLYIEIRIHSGYPCFRYCICHIANYEELYDYFSRL